MKGINFLNNKPDSERQSMGRRPSAWSRASENTHSADSTSPWGGAREGSERDWKCYFRKIPPPGVGRGCDPLNP